MSATKCFVMSKETPISTNRFCIIYLIDISTIPLIFSFFIGSNIAKGTKVIFIAVVRSP